MPFDGSGLFTPLTPEYPAVSGTVIYADTWNNLLDDLAQGLSLAITRDGQGTPTANISWGGMLLRDLGPGVLGTDAVNLTQFQAVYTNQTFTGATLVNPTLTGATISADPAPADVSFKVPSTAWVVARVTGPAYSSAVNLFLFTNY